VARIWVTPEMLNDPAALRKFQEAQNRLGGALSRLLVMVEPKFLALQSQLESIENRVAVERRHFNEGVRDLNTDVRRFPGNVVASFRGFRAKPFFEAAPGSQTAPQVKL
jgi:LemA protein